MNAPLHRYEIIYARTERHVVHASTLEDAAAIARRDAANMLAPGNVRRVLSVIDLEQYPQGLSDK